MIAVVDYGMGNVRSILNALDYLGAEGVLTCDPDEISKSSAVILPGVGAFGDAMKHLNERNLPAILGAEVLGRRKPFLGICLGLELLAETSSEHGTHQGMGWLAADVVRFPDQPGLEVPHMGWNDMQRTREHPVLENLGADQLTFYFVHSYHVRCRDTDDVLGWTEHGGPFVAAIARDNIVATQFHPEKSQDSGLQLLSNFLSWKP